MRTCHGKLRYFDWDGQVHLAKGKTGGHQGGPLEMLIFTLTIHNLWGGVLEKFQEVRVVAYTDDGYIKAKMIVVLQVLAELKYVLIEDAGLELNVSKTSILPKGSPSSLCLMWLTASLLYVLHLLSFTMMSPSSRSDLKVSWVSVCLLVLMILYGTL
jgi:hypothetical protein